MACEWTGGQGGAAPRMNDVLKVGLRCPSVANLVLIRGRDEAFISAHGPVAANELPIVGIEGLRALRNVGVSDRNAELVVGTLIVKPDKFNSCIYIAVDKIAV